MATDLKESTCPNCGLRPHDIKCGRAGKDPLHTICEPCNEPAEERHQERQADDRR